MPSTKLIGFWKISRFVTFDTSTELDPTNQHYSGLCVGPYYELENYHKSFNILNSCMCTAMATRQSTRFYSFHP